jgi:hypothetical protein
MLGFVLFYIECRSIRTNSVRNIDDNDVLIG